MATVTFTSYSQEERMIGAFIMELKQKLMPLGAFTTKYEMTGKLVGDSIIVGKVASGDAATRTIGSNGTGSGSITGAKLTLPQPTAIQWEIPSGAGGAAEFFAVGKAQMAKLAAAILAVPFAKITKAAFGDAAGDKLVKAQNAFGRSSVGELGQLAADKGLVDPAMVLNAGYYWALLSDYAGGLLDKEAFQAGVLPNQAGMMTYQYPALPSNSQALTGIVADKTGVLVGIAPLLPGASAGDGDLISYEIVQDPDSQVAMCYSRWFSSNPSVMCGRAEVMAVAAVGNEDAIVRIVSE